MFRNVLHNNLYLIAVVRLPSTVRYLNLRSWNKWQSFLPTPEPKMMAGSFWLASAPWSGVHFVLSLLLGTIPVVMVGLGKRPLKTNLYLSWIFVTICKILADLSWNDKCSPPVSPYVTWFLELPSVSLFCPPSCVIIVLPQSGEDSQHTCSENIGLTKINKSSTDILTNKVIKSPS